MVRPLHFPTSPHTYNMSGWPTHIHYRTSKSTGTGTGNALGTRLRDLGVVRAFIAFSGGAKEEEEEEVSLEKKRKSSAPSPLVKES
jgi:hypothetical protein